MQIGHFAKAAVRLVGVVGALLILISTAEATTNGTTALEAATNGADAGNETSAADKAEAEKAEAEQAARKKRAMQICEPGNIPKDLGIVIDDLDKLSLPNRSASFETTFAKWDGTSRLLVVDTETTGDLAFYVVAQIGDEPAKEIPVRVSTREKVRVRNQEKKGWAIDLVMPEASGIAQAFWPSITYYVWACSAASTDPATAPSFVAVAEARASQGLTSFVLTVVLVGAFYLLVAYGHRASGRKFAAAMGLSASDRFTLNPIKLTAGLTGRGSISNLQTFVFSLIVLFLLTYIVLRTGVLSGLSENVIWLLGIVGGGAVGARIVAGARQKLTPLNLRWALKRDWLRYQTTSTSLITRDRELSVSRFQSIAFTSVVAIALLVNGFTDLETFTIPASLLGLLGASQAIYLGGKSVQPPVAGDEEIEGLNTLLEQTRVSEEALVKAAPMAHSLKEFQTALDGKTQPLDDYTAKLKKAANRFAQIFETKLPTKGIYGLEFGSREGSG